MPLNGLTSGIDHKLIFNDANGVQRFAIIEAFTSKEDATVSKEIGMDGQVRHPKFHQGWSGSFTAQRGSDDIDAYFAAQEASYNLGIDQVPVTISETISEADGSVSQYQYLNVVLTYEDAGNYSGTEIVKQRINFMASRKIRLA